MVHEHNKVVVDSTCSAVFENLGEKAATYEFNNVVLLCSAVGGLLCGLAIAIKSAVKTLDYGAKLVVISDAKGPHATAINGYYQRQKNLDYTKLDAQEGCEVVLTRRLATSNQLPQWVLTYTSSKGEPQILMHAEGLKIGSPQDVEKWSVLCATEGATFESQKLQVHVRMLSEDSAVMTLQENPGDGTQRWYCGRELKQRGVASESFCSPSDGQCPTCRTFQRREDPGCCWRMGCMCDLLIRMPALSAAFSGLYFALSLPVAHLTCIKGRDLPLIFKDNASTERTIVFGTCLGLLLPVLGYKVYSQAMWAKWDVTVLGVLAALHTCIQFVPFVGLLLGSCDCESGLRYEYYAAEAIILVLALPRMAMVNKDMERGQYCIPGTSFRGLAFRIYSFVMAAIESTDMFLDLCSSSKAFVCRYWRARWMFYCVIGGFVLQNYLVLLFLGRHYWSHAIIGVGPDSMLRMAHGLEAEKKLQMPLEKAKTNIKLRRIKAYIRVVTLSRLITEHLPLLFLQWDFVSSNKENSSIFSTVLTDASLGLTLVCALRVTMNALFLEGATTQRHMGSKGEAVKDDSRERLLDTETPRHVELEDPEKRET